MLQETAPDEGRDEVRLGAGFFARLTAFVVWLALIVCGAVGLVLWEMDVHADRQHTITVNSSTPVFRGSGGSDCSARPVLTAVQHGAALRVQRIRYWKNCNTIDVLLSDGRRGCMVMGVGDVSVAPPLR